jgi:hypothetical protein
VIPELSKLATSSEPSGTVSESSSQRYSNHC